DRKYSGLLPFDKEHDRHDEPEPEKYEKHLVDEVSRDVDHARRKGKKERRKQTSDATDVTAKKERKQNDKYAPHRDTRADRNSFKTEYLNERERDVVERRTVVIRRIVLVRSIAK